MVPVGDLDDDEFLPVVPAGHHKQLVTHQDRLLPVPGHVPVEPPVVVRLLLLGTGMNGEERESDEGGKDVFVHISAVERAGLTGLQDNQKISYELQSGRDGRASASDLKLL